MRNWAGNVEYHARRLLEPESLEALQEAVRSSRSLRALGSRHAFNGIADTTGDQVSLARLRRVFELDPAAGTVTVDAATRYGDLARPLHAAGFALHNLASLPHISVAGACATATHGSGDRLGNLSTAVRALEVVRADGESATVDRSTDGAGGLRAEVAALGALGIVTRLTLAIEPAYEVRQVVYGGMDAATWRRRFDEITAAGDSVSTFTTWRGPIVDQVWVKQRVAVPAVGEPPADLFGAPASRVDVHPLPGMDAAACTPQRGVPGAWFERLPHFRMDHTPSAGDELQTEYFVGREDAVAAYDALDALRDRIAPLVQVNEIRTIAADDLWLSPAFRRASVGLHFTWRPDWPSVRALLPEIEAALRPFAPRPHWAKLFTMAPDELASRFERFGDFASLTARLDPDGKLRNDFLDRYLGAAS
jgi:alditol oxidase